jgi:hypothetical protein
MPTTTTRTHTHEAPAPLTHEITLAFIVGDKTTHTTMQAASHAQALQTVEKAPNVTVYAFYSPIAEALPLAAMHVTANTLSGIANRGTAKANGEAIDAPFSPRQQSQLLQARRTLRAMAQHGPEAVRIPRDIEDYFQTATLALLNHLAPLSTIAPRDIQEAYRLAMCAVQKAYRADTRNAQQAEAGQEMPRMYGSPTMPKSTPYRPAPKAYREAIASIRQALPSEQARAVLDAWKEHPEASTRELAELVDGKKSIIAKHVKRIRDIANALYPNGIPAK